MVPAPSHESLQHPRGIPLLTPAQSTYVHFRTHHLLPNTPVLFPPSTTSTWPAFASWTTSNTFPSSEVDYAYLEQIYGSLPVEVLECLPSSSASSTLPATFVELLRLWKAGEGRNLYLKDWHLPLIISGMDKVEGGKRSVGQELYTVPDSWKDDWMNDYYGAETEDDFRFVYAGGGDTFTPLHRDVYASYSVSTNLCGAKLWTLFPACCTPLLLPLIAGAEREGRSVDVREWDEKRKATFMELGMLEVRQEAGESIFIPSGYYHHVTNLSHPTLSLNHNWCNSHNLPSIYRSMVDEVKRCRAAIDDVRELLMGREGEWRGEWEECVSELVRQSAGWNWTTFWRMVRHALQRLDSTATATPPSRWPSVPSHARPPTSFVVAQIRPLLADCLSRPEEEHRWTDGLRAVLDDLEEHLSRLELSST